MLAGIPHLCFFGRGLEMPVKPAVNIEALRGSGRAEQRRMARSGLIIALDNDCRSGSISITGRGVPPSLYSQCGS